MKEVTNLIRKKGQLLINQLQNDAMFVRHNLQDDATTAQKDIADAKVKVIYDSIKKVRDTFEIPEPDVLPEAKSNLFE